MTFRRLLAILLALMLLTGFAAAENVMPQPDVTMLPVYAPAGMTPEDIQAFVEAMFAAAVGTNVEHENELRMDITEEEVLERDAANADYRARTLPWLIAAFSPVTDVEPAETQTPEPTVNPTPEPGAPPVYTIEDSFAAFAETEPGKAYLAQMESFGGTDPEICLKITREICGMWMAQVDHAKLMEMNGDYRCWIYAPGTQIDYPVVQSGDNSHYLKRMFNGERNSAGTLFIDYRNLPDFQDPNTLIYGHHMRNDSMFGTLTDYAKQAYYEEHPVMLVMAEKEIFLLEIFAGYTTSDRDHCYDIAISDEEDMAAFIDEAVRKSDFVSGVQVRTTDRLVTLSTCAYTFEAARYVLIGRIVPVRAAEMEEAEDAEQEN